MLRSLFLAVAGLALAALVAADRSPKAAAADADLTGNWLLTYSQTGAFSQNTAILRVEMKDGKPVASVVFTPGKAAPPKITAFEIADGKTVKFNLGLASFEGTVGADGKAVVGNYGNDQVAYRAKLTRTDKTELAANETLTRNTPPAPMADAQKLITEPNRLRFTANQEKDPDKKKEILDKIPAAEKEANEKAPALLREVLGKHADSLFALDAAVMLLQNGAKFKLTAEEANGVLDTIEKQSTAYGARFARFQTLQAVEALVSHTCTR
jgi:hypothetical protein